MLIICLSHKIQFHTVQLQITEIRPPKIHAFNWFNLEHPVILIVTYHHNLISCCLIFIQNIYFYVFGHIQLLDNAIQYGVILYASFALALHLEAHGIEFPKLT